jgi:hypothetical protein
MFTALRAVFFVVVALLPVCVFGQADANSTARTVLITGHVIDIAGSGIPQTSVILRPLGTDQKVAETKTNKDGDFALPEIPAGAYELHFFASGAESQTRRISETDHGVLDIGTVKLWLGEYKPYFLAPNPLAPNMPSTRIQTSLCDLIANPNLFHGKFVEIHANVRSPKIEALATVFDAKCRAGMLLLMLDEASPNEISAGSIEEIRKLGRRLSNGQIAEATIMGKFEIQLVLGGRLEFKFSLLSASGVKSAIETAIRQ